MLFSGLLDLFFPKLCVGCQFEGKFLCQSCEKELWRVQHQADEDKVVSCGSYHRDLVLKRLISLFKYKFSKESGTLLLKLMIRVWACYSQKLGTEVLSVPVPLHKSRKNYRGFNQAAFLAEGLAKSFSSLNFYDCLRRFKKGRVQAGLNRMERANNLKGGIFLEGIVQNKKVLLIDDVTTTGATLQECREVLKRAGAKEVWALVLARADDRIKL